LTRFLPVRETIEAFGNGGFRFGSMSHQGSLLILPSGMRAWEPTKINEMKISNFDPIFAEKSSIDMLLIGTGANMEFLPKVVTAELRAQGLNFDAMTTSSAIHVYNVVLNEGRRVAAAFISVADAVG
jgi:uncharacterized protein